MPEKSRDIRVLGFPDSLPEKEVALCRVRILNVVNELMQRCGLDTISLGIASGEGGTAAAGTAKGAESRPASPGSAPRPGRGDADDMPVEVRATRYRSTTPLYRFDQLVVPQTLKEDLMAALGVIGVHDIVFQTWGLSKIEPFPRTALSFQGPPGTGKTLAAHALASHLNRPILLASYADVESKFHGDGPKNIEAVFHAAQRDGAVLFIDEAESLLSKRLLEANTGSESAINSMRSQLLICLERFRGVVIFATNLVSSYDPAFDTRVRHVEFPLPDEKCRQAIWRAHLPEELPKREGFSIERLAAHEGAFCGRDIKNAVVDAAIRAALANRVPMVEEDFLAALERVRESRIKRDKPPVRELTPEERTAMEEKIKKSLNP